MKVKYSDFNVADKANLVELFVTHQNTLRHIYMSIFPQTTNIDRNYENLKAHGSGQNIVDLDFENQRRQSTGYTHHGDLLLNDNLLHQVLRDSELRNEEH